MNYFHFLQRLSPPKKHLQTLFQQHLDIAIAIL